MSVSSVWWGVSGFSVCGGEYPLRSDPQSYCALSDYLLILLLLENVYSCPTVNQQQAYQPATLQAIA